MKPEKMLNTVLACMLVIGLAAPAHAAEVETFAWQTVSANSIMPCATKSFTVTVPAKTELSSNTSFSLASGESVTINASYSPSSASVDFGLAASDDICYYFSGKNGSINRTMEISENGSYTLQIRNNSNVSVKVTGFVKY